MTPGWRARTGAIGVLTGAGISTDSGIPDFRGPRGVWTTDPIAELMSTYQSYVADPELRERSWPARRDNPAWRAQPNEAHRALVELARTRTVRIITQNIDRLHHKAEQLNTRTVLTARLIAEHSAIFLAVGTSLQVEPAASLCSLAVEHGADLVIVNAEATPYDSIAAEVIREPIGSALPTLAQQLAAI